MNDLKNYKYDEFGYAEKIYKSGFQTKHIPTEIKLLALYLRDVLVLKPAELKDSVYEFCENNIEGFNKVLWFKVINKALKYATDKKSCLVTIDSVDISKAEADYLSSLNVSHEYRKLFLAFLVQMRLNKLVSEQKNSNEYNSIYFRGGMRKYNAIKKMANVPAKLDINSGFIRDMSAIGLIGIYYNGLIKHHWLERCSNSGDVVIKVRDFDNVGLYWDYYCGVSGVKLCKHCGEPFKASRKDRVYCPRHKDYHISLGDKVIQCSDCGREMEVPAKANNVKRCAECQRKRRLEADKTRKSK